MADWAVKRNGIRRISYAFQSRNGNEIFRSREFMELIKACTEKAKKEDILRACMMRTDGRPARQADILQRKENLPEKIVRIQ